MGFNSAFKGLNVLMYVVGHFAVEESEGICRK
jgi:hypothetical protein